MVIATSGMCFRMAHKTVAGCVTVSTQRLCASFTATTWKRRVMAPTLAKWKTSDESRHAFSRVAASGACRISFVGTKA